MSANSEKLLYDSPEDITNVDLTIRAVSGNISPVIYANGRNQLPVEIIAKAMKKDPVTRQYIVLKFSQETWLHILNLRHAESDEKLTWQGSTGWCYTHTANDYSREVITSGGVNESRYMEPGDELMTFFVYTDNTDIKRIAVSIDTDGGKHFTTADNASGAEMNSVSVRAMEPVSYSNGQNLRIISDNWVDKIKPIKYKDQEKGVIWANEHEGGGVRQRKFSIATLNGYRILNRGIPPALSGKKQAGLYHHKLMPHALSVASLPDGAYMNSWFVSPDGEDKGYASGLNGFFVDMSTNYSFPDLYFCDNTDGEYTGTAWAFWPYIADDDNRGWETFPVVKESISVVCIQIYVPDTSPIYWGKYCRPDYISDPPAPVSIVDIYGNSGEFNVTFESSANGGILISP